MLTRLVCAWQKTTLFSDSLEEPSVALMQNWRQNIHLIKELGAVR
jgi:hypothetical protein